MSSWPRDAPLSSVLATLRSLGFGVVRAGEHISLRGFASDGTPTAMTLPNHRTIRGSTLRTACRLAGIDRDAFLEAYRRS